MRPLCASAIATGRGRGPGAAGGCRWPGQGPRRVLGARGGRKRRAPGARERLPARGRSCRVQQRSSSDRHWRGGAGRPLRACLLCCPAWLSRPPNQSGSTAIPSSDPQLPAHWTPQPRAPLCLSSAEGWEQRGGRQTAASKHGGPPRPPAGAGRAGGGAGIPGARPPAPAACRRLSPPAAGPPAHSTPPPAPPLPGRHRHALGGGHPAPGEAVGQAAGRERWRREPRGRQGAAGRRGAGGKSCVGAAGALRTQAGGQQQRACSCQQDATSCRGHARATSCRGHAPACAHCTPCPSVPTAFHHPLPHAGCAAGACGGAGAGQGRRQRRAARAHQAPVPQPGARGGGGAGARRVSSGWLHSFCTGCAAANGDMHLCLAEQRGWKQKLQMLCTPYHAGQGF